MFLQKLQGIGQLQVQIIRRRMALGGTLANLRMLSSKPAGSSIDVIEEQSLKAQTPMLVRPVGSAIDVIEEQPQKA